MPIKTIGNGAVSDAAGEFLTRDSATQTDVESGIWLRVTTPRAEVMLANNLLVGAPKLAADGHWTRRANFAADWDEFVRAARDDFRLKPESSLRGKAQDMGEAEGLRLSPSREYRHPHASAALAGPARHPGAFQS